MSRNTFRGALPHVAEMRRILAVMEGMSDVVATLPEVLDEPRIYLSAAQAEKCRQYPRLSNLVLPGWVKLSLVSDALGFGKAGIDSALQYTQQVPWLWATEFENVHSTWNFVEPHITIDGQEYKDSETYYKAEQDKLPFSRANGVIWDSKKVKVMTRAVTAKFNNSAEARQLLISTHPFPLLSIKNDSFWGFDARYGDQNMLAQKNMLAQILMDLRQKYVNGELVSGAELAHVPSPHMRDHGLALLEQKNMLAQILMDLRHGQSPPMRDQERPPGYVPSPHMRDHFCANNTYFVRTDTASTTWTRSRTPSASVRNARGTAPTSPNLSPTP